MKFIQPRLPYTPDALEPTISQTTIEYHYGKHEKAYLDTLNTLIENTEYENMPMEEIIMKSEGKLFNNAAQAWNHICYFFQFAPNGQKAPGGKLMEQIEEQFGSFEQFQKDFVNAGVTLFGSGWVWLASDTSGKLFIVQKQNAGNPMTDGLTPILVFDVWEHAYYLDYQNRRADYLNRLWDIVDWQIVENRYNL
ncbi:MAG: superoxide dismutase [Muribaculaceae bacterium]|nr:superoxide dismutase [Muribaculaceae bacterium]